MKGSIIILIPVLNNAETIGRIVEQCLGIQPSLGVRPRVIVIDDGSTDGSGEIAKKAGAIVLRHEKNLGKGAALETGFQEVRLPKEVGLQNIDFIVTLDADGQHDPAEIPKLLEAAEEKNALVIARRDFSTAAGHRMSFFRKIGNRTVSLLISFLLGEKFSDTQSGLRVFPISLVRGLTFQEKKYGIETEMIFRAKDLGIPITEVPIQTTYKQLPRFKKRRWELTLSIWRWADLLRAIIQSALSSATTKKILLQFSSSHTREIFLAGILILLFFQLRLLTEPILKDKDIIISRLKQRNENASAAKTLAAFNWLKNNTPEDAIILTPPYEAHRIMAFADRHVIASGKVYPSETKELAERLRDLSRFFFTTDIAEANAIIEKYGAQYIFLPRRPFFLEFCNAGEACHWATYRDKKELTPDGKQKTFIGKLLAEAELPEFRKIWSSPNFLIYQINEDPGPPQDEILEEKALEERVKLALENILRWQQPDGMMRIEFDPAKSQRVETHPRITFSAVITLVEGSKTFGNRTYLEAAKKAADAASLSLQKEVEPRWTLNLIYGALANIEFWKYTKEKSYLEQSEKFINNILTLQTPSGFFASKFRFTDKGVEPTEFKQDLQVDHAAFFALTEYFKISRDPVVWEVIQKMKQPVEDRFLEERISAAHQRTSLDTIQGAWLLRAFRNLYEIDGAKEDGEFVLALGRWLIESQNTEGPAAIRGAFRNRETSAPDSSQTLTTVQALNAMLDAVWVAEKMNLPTGIYRESAAKALLHLMKMQYNPDAMDLIPAEQKKMLLGGIRENWTSEKSILESTSNFALAGLRYLHRVLAEK